jgi:tRNA pseudouridine55 synthase
LNEEIKDDNEYENKIILAVKPLGMTSAGVVRILKRHFKVKKIGHSGTLDPKATGLLILCTGKMTKKISEFIDCNKEYTGIIKIGARTKSYDTETVEEEHKDLSGITEEKIIEAAGGFLGEIEQIPPMFSAIKIKGKPLYKLARKGKEIERSPRKIKIERFEVRREKDDEISFIINCSKGTYIRSIANDFGNKLGVGGYLKELKRTKIGKYKLADFDKVVYGISYKVLHDLN